MTRIYWIGISLLVFLATGIGCKSPVLPEGQEGLPVFWMNAEIGEESWEATAGKAGYFMETDYALAEAGVYVFAGKLGPFACEECTETLEIRIWDAVGDSLRSIQGFDDALDLKPYGYFKAEGQPGPDVFRVAFENQSSGTAPFSYSWDLGDGTTSPAVSPTHQYGDSLEQVEVCLDSEDANGCVTRICNEVLLDEEPCSVDFSHTLSAGTSYVSFRAEATGSPPFTYRWDFGDGFTASLGNPGYFYAQAGQYEVCLEVSDFFGCKRSICKLIAADPLLCETGFSYKVEKVATVDPAPQFNRVQVIWYDAAGTEFRSDRFTQPVDYGFFIDEVETYEANAAGEATWRTNVRFDVRLFAPDSSFVDMTNAGGWIGLAHP